MWNMKNTYLIIWDERTRDSVLCAINLVTDATSENTQNRCECMVVGSRAVTSSDITSLTYVKMGLQPSSQVQYGADRYWRLCLIRILNSIGRKTTPASNPCLFAAKFLNCINSGHFNSYMSTSMLWMFPTTNITLNHAYTPWRPLIPQYYSDESIIDDATLLNKLIILRVEKPRQLKKPTRPLPM